MGILLAPTPLTETECFIPGVKSAHPQFAARGARVIEGTIHNMARFYDAPVEGWRDYCNYKFAGSDLTSKWINRSFRNHEEARTFCASFVVPQEIKAEAQSLSRELVRDLVQAGGTPRMIRNQPRGRFDAGRAARIITDLHRGRFDPDITRPFKARHRVAPSRPHVGICVDGSWSQFNRDDTYIPRAVALGLGIAWACEAVNCSVTAAITRSNYSTQFGTFDMAVTPIIAPGLHTSTSDLAVLFHPELYRSGTSSLICQTMGNVMQRYLRSEHDVRQMSATETWNEGSADGGTGVAYLRSRGATITVAIGNVTDRKDATIALEANTPLRDAVKIIAETLAKQNRAMGVAA